MTKRRESGKQVDGSRAETLARTRRRLTLGTTVTLATFGCSSCADNGAVDPPPPPFRCEDVSGGEGFRVSEATASETLITIDLEHRQADILAILEVSGVLGFVLESVSLLDGRGLRIQLRREPPGTLEGHFTIRARVRGYDDTVCDVRRVFTIAVSGTEVEVTRGFDDLPLRDASRARIELMGRDGLAVRLRAIGAQESTTSWTVTEGDLRVESPEAVVWTLPSTPGFYQIELLTDHGAAGFGFDTLAFEVA